MIYTNLYHKFISSRPIRTRVAFDGLERHHIIPRSIGGSNSKDNLIVLTAREHFIAHRILAKMYKGDDATKMALAVHRMATGAHKLKYRINSRTYQHLRELRSKAYQHWLKSPIGEAFRQRQSERNRKSMSPAARARWQERYRSFIGPRLPRRTNKGKILPVWTPERRAKVMSKWTPKRRALQGQCMSVRMLKRSVIPSWSTQRRANYEQTIKARTS
jgi:hypothetical protein